MDLLLASRTEDIQCAATIRLEAPRIEHALTHVRRPCTVRAAKRSIYRLHLFILDPRERRWRALVEYLGILMASGARSVDLVVLHEAMALNPSRFAEPGGARWQTDVMNRTAWLTTEGVSKGMLAAVDAELARRDGKETR
jgi:hypothetical protein